jgi:hypothetical protein
MKRDMDLIRKILLQIEESESSDIPKDLSIEGYTREQIKHHLKLLSDRKFITPEYSEVRELGSVSTSGTEDNRPRRLTDEAYDFLDAIRSENVWKKTKDSITKNGGGFVLGVVKDLATSILRKEMGLS